MKKVFSRKQDKNANKNLSLISATDFLAFDEHQIGIGGIHLEDIHRLREQERKFSIKTKKSRNRD